MEQYRAVMNPLGEFLEQCCRRDPDGFVPVGSLYERYRDWSDEQGARRRLTKVEFGRKLGELELERTKRGGVRGWLGLRLVRG